MTHIFRTRACGRKHAVTILTVSVSEDKLCGQKVPFSRLKFFYVSLKVQSLKMSVFIFFPHTFTFLIL